MSVYAAAGATSQTTEKQATGLHFIREVSVNYRGPRRATAFIGKARDAADFIRRVLPDNAREHFVTLYLDAGHKVAAFAVTATGTANSCPVHPREVFQGAVLTGATAILVGHNHPSGDPLPSTCDREITAKLKDAGTLLGIKLLDHVVLGDEGFYSFAEQGEI